MAYAFSSDETICRSSSASAFDSSSACISTICTICLIVCLVKTLEICGSNLPLRMRLKSSRSFTWQVKMVEAYFTGSIRGMHYFGIPEISKSISAQFEIAFKGAFMLCETLA